MTESNRRYRQECGTLPRAVQSYIATVDVGEVITSAQIGKGIHGTTTYQAGKIPRLAREMRCLKEQEPTSRSVTNQPLTQFKRVFDPSEPSECHGCRYANHSITGPRATCIIYSAVVDEARSEQID